jgi:hypothetical protein
MINPQPPALNTTADLLDAGPSAGLEVSQLHLLSDFYRLDWHAPEIAAAGGSGLRLLACLLVVSAGVWLAYRAAAGIEPPPSTL